MKILFSTDSFHPSIDGAVTALASLSNYYRTKNHEIFFITPKLPKLNGNGSDENIFETYSIFLPNLPRPITIPKIRSYPNEIENQEFDIVHTHSPFGTGVLARNIAAKQNIPCLFTMHTLIHEYLHYAKPLDNLLKKPTINFFRRFCNSVDCVIAPTETIKDLLQNWGISTAIKVLPSGIDPKTIITDHPSDIRLRYNIPSDIPLILFVGRLGKEKNLAWLIDALQSASERKIPFHCFMIGDGNERKNLEKTVVQKSLKEKVTFTGFIPQNELANYYASGDLLCIPSMTETQCLAAVEAMMNRVPVLGVRAMGIQNTIQQGVNGLLTEPDPIDFIETFCDLLKNKEKRETLREGAFESTRTLTAEICAERHLNLYERLISHQLEYEREIALREPLNFVPMIVKSLIGF